MSSEDHDIGPQEVNTGKVALIGAVGVLTVAVLIVLTQFYFYAVASRIALDQQVDAPSKKTQGEIAAQRSQLEDYRWVDQKAGTVAVPIGRAMELALTGRRAPGGPATPAPMPPADQGKASGKQL
jgi:hypothetical protein